MRCGSTPHFLGLERSPRAHRYQIQRNSSANPTGAVMLDRRGRDGGNGKVTRAIAPSLFTSRSLSALVCP
ncbi:MAG: hypothetical protein ACFCA4_13885 [Cyanophyceae cyanobacterium]